MEKNSVSVPDELVFDILTRLPVKFLLRFGCVCKRWRSMISDPSFVEAHQSRSATATALLISFPAMRCPDRKRTLFSINEGDARPLFGFSDRNISQSVNGLICIYEQYPPKRSPCVRVCNPSTREYVTLPPTIFLEPGFRSQSNYLGFDPSTKTYKVLRAWKGEFGRSKYEIFTLGSHAWRIIKDGPEDALETKGICLNGTIYWTKAGPVTQNSVIAFDIGEEKFRCVPVPPASPIWTDYSSSIIQIGGHIAIVDYLELAESISNVMIMWKLEDSVNGVWSQKRLVLPECWILSRVRYLRLRPFFVTSIDGGEITLIPSWLFRDWYVVHYDLEEEGPRREFVSGLPHDDWDGSFPSIDCCSVSVYVESVVSLKEICRLQSFRFRK
ncbi:hypothetical protein PVL29_000139 [Vitis rotundifolia]|uniref:F-box domain-containing protein n=1 Tax=Vitis rotundifolia TaxID=103349 RepID=A0AA39AHV6_VITRO|nr:hypothetical protein PVL29_000139 [Vitis rotundifolia]